MRKSTFIKRFMALFLVVLMSINTFAAVVGDNDGAAFITKAEFDSMKNDFQSQLDRYNSSIDNKVDGAIASYLSGVRISKVNQKSILTKDWTTGYTMLNGALANGYSIYPDVSANAAGYWFQKNGGVTDYQVANNYNRDGKIVNVWFNFSTGKQSHTTNPRNLVKNVTVGTTPNKTRMTWAGRATNARESWTLSQIKQIFGDPGYMVNTRGNECILCEYLNLTYPGYYSSFTSTSNSIWTPSFRWAYKTSDTASWSYNNLGYGTYLASSAIPAISYEADSTGKIIEYEHIGSYKSNTAWEVTMQDVTNYALHSGNDTRTTAAWTSKVTSKSGKWSGCEVGYAGPEKGSTDLTSFPKIVTLSGFVTDSNINWTNNTSGGSTNTHYVPVLGLLSGTQPANTIYQFQDLLDDNGTRISPITLNQGLPLFQVKQDEFIEWTPIFKNLTSTASGNKYVVIKLAYVPFGNEANISTGNTTDLVRCDFSNYDTTKYGTWTDSSSYVWPRSSVYNTTSKTCTVPIKFKASKDGIVYAKFWVYTTAVATDNWEVTLDIENSSTYMSTEE